MTTPALKTESPSTAHPDLDNYLTPDLIAAFIEDQHDAVAAVGRAAPMIARAVEAALPRIQAGGRLLYVGAGTSGRLGLLDSVELYPTFSWPRERAVAVLAGGRTAVYQAVEGAEDDSEQGARDLAALDPSPNDVVLLVAASGTTPYVRGALAKARALQALAVGFSNNPGTPVVEDADIGITLDTGAELISGSTRLKAGTAQKIALNTFSSALMVRLNKVYGNLMVDVVPTNAKLVRRAIRLTMLAADCDEATAKSTLEAAHFQVKVAIVAIRRGLTTGKAAELLQAASGSVRAALSPGIE
ncbi:MAG: N-acetylmuramic acid 6-phosphate etherase [Betaproteobacteria bacterium]|nr:N-acetylmuramic acid 6-phosphate etherase [Betaproteobacteria bacterium]